MQNELDELFMNRAFELAKKGIGYVSPNPLVGCVIVHENRIIGEGWHQKYGEAHAEVNAINSVEDRLVLKDSTIYVNLEPCSHFGKTPPCAELLIIHQLKRVVVANKDPFPLVNGGGIEKLKRAGIDVEDEFLAKEGATVNRRFFTFQTKKRPYIILKWAQTADGFIARENYNSKWISNEYSRKLVHKWRAEEDAILVGKNTVKYDNPSLNVRDWIGENPIRIVVDKNLELSEDLNIFDRQIPTIIYNAQASNHSKNIQKISVNFDTLLENLLQDLYKRKILSLIVEGGTHTINQFIHADLWDEASVFISKAKFGNGIKAPFIQKNKSTIEKLKEDSLLFFYRTKNQL